MSGPFCTIKVKRYPTISIAGRNGKRKLRG
jgi:hypothetical protein